MKLPSAMLPLPGTTVPANDWPTTSLVSGLIAARFEDEQLWSPVVPAFLQYGRKSDGAWFGS